MPNSENFLTLSVTESRSPSPRTPSPSREIRGLQLFRAISRKLGRRSTEDVRSGEDADSRSSSTDSCSSTSAGRCSRLKKYDATSSADSGYRSTSLHHISSSSSDTGSDTHSAMPRHSHSISTENLRRVLQRLTINTKPRNCIDGKDSKKKTKKAPKKILRSPVTYTYVKGLSGLPTQRVYRNPHRVYLSNSCSCNMQYIMPLHR